MKIFSFILMICLLPLISPGQDEEYKKPEKRSDNYIHMDGIRVGMDITRPFQSFWTLGDRYGTELTFDVEVKPNLYAVVETGWEKMEIDQEYVNYESSGSYTRLGIDYNFLEALNRKERNILYAGLRYAVSYGQQSIPYYSLNDYWEDYPGYFPERTYFTQWAEALIGLKAEIFHNFFFGWSVRGKILIHQPNVETPYTYFGPGYGKSETNFNLDFTYTVSYCIPFNFSK